VAWAAVIHGSSSLRAAALVHLGGEGADAGGHGGQIRRGGKDGVQADPVGVGEPVWPGHDPAGHGPDLRRDRGRGGRVSAETREVAADLPATALVSAVAGGIS